MSLAEYQQLAAEQAQARSAAQRLAAQIRAALGGERIVWIRLYGSLARGDWNGPDDSDVDVAVVVHDRSDADVLTILRLADAELLVSGLVFSPMIFSPAEFEALHRRELRLPREILQQGILL